MINRRVVFWSAIVGVWMVLGVISSVDLFFVLKSLEHDISWGQVFFWAMPDMLIWAGLTPLIALLASRLSLEKGRWISSLSLLFGVSLVMPLVQHTLDSSLNAVVDTLNGEQTAAFSQYWYNLTFEYYELFATFWMIVGFVYLFHFYRRHRDQELEAKELESQLSQAQLQALKMQLNPHFLFNTLNAISALVEEDQIRAKQVIAKLGDLLRISLDSSSVIEIALQQELEFLEKYLEIEQVRFGERLSVEFKIEEETRNARVPNLILQPLVENAVHHGIAQNADGGRIEISALRSNGQLRLSVRDDGSGIEYSSGAKIHEGIGVGNTRERLTKLYGESALLTLHSGLDGGTNAEIRMPFSVIGKEETEST
jgi:signal transduction histidine kinase